jgi:hypothetical protein
MRDLPLIGHFPDLASSQSSILSSFNSAVSKGHRKHSKFNEAPGLYMRLALA